MKKLITFTRYQDGKVIYFCGCRRRNWEDNVPKFNEVEHHETIISSDRIEVTHICHLKMAFFKKKYKDLSSIDEPTTQKGER